MVDAVWAIINEPFCQLIEDAINEALANIMGGEGFALKTASAYVTNISGPSGGPSLRCISLLTFLIFTCTQQRNRQR